MKLYKFEPALDMANAVCGSKLRVCCGGAVAEAAGDYPAREICTVYGHLPVEEISLEENIIYVKIWDSPETHETCNGEADGECSEDVFSALKRLFLRILNIGEKKEGELIWTTHCNVMR